jgi:hypothetical protein
MPACKPLPTQRLANAVIAIVVICSIGALYDGWSCDFYCGMHDLRYRKFWSHLPFYLLGAIAISEAFSWGLLRKMLPVSKVMATSNLGLGKVRNVNMQRVAEGLFITGLSVAVVSIFIWLNG